MSPPRTWFLRCLPVLLLCVVVTDCGDGPPAHVASEPGPLVAGAPKLQTPAVAPRATVTPPRGYDVSHPQCRKSLPTDGGFGIVGITRGKPLTTNPCLARELRWARAHRGYAVYLNTSFPRRTDPVAWGRTIARDAIAREHTAGTGGVPMWWLDVETVNDWVGSAQENATVLDAVAVTLQQSGARVGIYSSPSMWTEIAGAWMPSLPTWLAGGPGTAVQALAACVGPGFSGQPPALVQWVQRSRGRQMDHDLICPSMRTHARDILVAR